MVSSFVTSVARPRHLVVALAATAALALAACGGGGSSSSSTTSSSTTPETTTSSTTSTSTSANTTSTTSDLRAAFDKALRQNLVQQQNLSSSQADCVLNELEKTLSDADIQAVINGQTPKAVTQAAFNAGVKCASQ
jgi:ABC-type oligopeptide transport system substrate-binding subunit